MKPKKVKWVMKNSSDPIFNLWEAHCYNGNKYKETFPKEVDPNDILPYGNSHGTQLSANDYRKYYLKYVKHNVQIEQNNEVTIKPISITDIKDESDMDELLKEIGLDVDNILFKGE